MSTIRKRLHLALCSLSDRQRGPGYLFCGPFPPERFDSPVSGDGQEYGGGEPPLPQLDLSASRQLGGRNVERNGKQIFLQDLLPELTDLDVKLDTLTKAITPTNFYYDEELEVSGRELTVDLDGDESFLRTLARSHRSRLLSHAALAAGVVLLIGVTLFSSIRLTSISRVKREIDDTISRYRIESDEQFDSIQTFISSADLDLQVLKDNPGQQGAGF